MNPSPYETLFGMTNSSLIDKVKAKYDFTLQLGGQGSRRDDAISFERTDLSGGTQQETIHIPDAWMIATGASSAEEFIQKLQEA